MNTLRHTAMHGASDGSFSDKNEGNDTVVL